MSDLSVSMSAAGGHAPPVALPEAVLPLVVKVPVWFPANFTLMVNPLLYWFQYA